MPEMNDFYEMTEELLSFIKSSPTCYHAVETASGMLAAAGAIELREDRRWSLTPGKLYFVSRNGSSLIAFRVPEEPADNFQIIASHSDSPTFKLKEREEVKDGHYVRLNVERYGGMLCAPWFDRPLSIAGKVMTRENGRIRTSLVNLDRDLVLIPNLAIHQNREANSGFAYKIQTDLLPILGDAAAEGAMPKLIAEALSTDPDHIVESDQIIGTDLFLYNRTAPSIWGASREFVSAPRLDDLQCAFSSLRAFLSGGNAHSITVYALFDNEEVGSGSKQGADSTFVEDVLRRINTGLGGDNEDYLMKVASGFMLSADNAHAVHPAHPEKSDRENRPYMNCGPVVKFNANQKYTTDSVSAAIFTDLCRSAGIPFQVFANHSDQAGGSTLGNIANSHISMNTVDIGCAQLAMHSPYETAGVKDTLYMEKAMEAFYHTHITRNENGDYELC